MRRPAHRTGVRVRLGVPFLAALAAIALAGCGGGGSSAGGATTSARTAGSSTLAGGPQARPRRARHHRLTPTERKLIAGLRKQLGLAGKGTGAYVYDITTGTQLFALRDSVKRPPASVEKLFTSVAVLRMLGPRVRLHTTVFGTGHLGAGGVWHGDLYLRGGGDPTFGDGTFNTDYFHGYGPTASQLASQLVKDGIRSVTGHVYGDASLFDSRLGPPSSGYQPDIDDLGGELAGLTYDHGASGLTPGMPGYSASTQTGTTTGAATAKPVKTLSPGAFAAHQLAVTLGQMHVSATAATLTRRTPHRAHPLAIVSSAPASEILRLMDVPSDDFIAEMLTKQMGAQIVGKGTTAAGTFVIRSALGEYDLHPKIVDGSGLSRSDLASPLQVVDLLRALNGTSTGDLLDSALPTVGVDGTVQTIATGTPAVGRCIAKTGTLDNVTNLAGYCHSRGRQLVAFALFVDGPPNWTALTNIGRMVAAIASY